MNFTPKTERGTLNVERRGFFQKSVVNFHFLQYIIISECCTQEDSSSLPRNALMLGILSAINLNNESYCSKTDGNLNCHRRTHSARREKFQRLHPALFVKSNPASLFVCASALLRSRHCMRHQNNMRCTFETFKWETHCSVHAHKCEYSRAPPRE